MPSINRIRVNNVKYNFGSQYYDDFTMRMYGKNTLYDLANGGGKSVLMLLLLQNMMPNCTLDEKQPIEKLFRTGNGNTTIHSLVEWKLDGQDNVNGSDNTEGYRYMTTGFCARKAKDSEGETDNKREVASVEYFNYCIFYREYNRNDIVNLPLVRDGERITFQGLRSYLKELPHKDMALKVLVFDRKGEYQRFISRYGVHESQWEIIRGINKTEGHVRTYFENNYKTTRKVVEDLLIEEIIEKAYMVKTERDESGTDSMAQMLMDIKEQLTILARKKKDIAVYDHEIELVKLLNDKVSSFMDLYREQSALRKSIADICVTGEEFARNDERRMAELTAERDEKREQKNRQRERIECLKVAKDKKQLETLRREAETCSEHLEECKRRLDTLHADLNMKESVNDYFSYMEDRKKYALCDSVIRNMMSESSFDEELLYTYAYNIKKRMDAVFEEIRGQAEALAAAVAEAEEKKEQHDRLLREADMSLAVAVNAKRAADGEIVTLSEKLSGIRMEMHNIRFTQLDEQRKDSDLLLAELRKHIEQSDERIAEIRRLLAEETLHLSQLTDRQRDNKRQLEELSAGEKEYRQTAEKLENIRQVYGAGDTDRLVAIIEDRITKTILECENIGRELEASAKRRERLKEGRLIGLSEAAANVLEYIETRHGVTAMYGMDYLSALPIEMRKSLLAANPELPYGILVKEFETIKDDRNIFTVDTKDVCVNIFNMDRVEDKAILFGENTFAVHAQAEYLTNENTGERLLAAEEEKYREQELLLESKQELLEAYRQDREFVYGMSDGASADMVRRLEEAREAEKAIAMELSACNEKVRGFRAAIEREAEEAANARQDYERCLSDAGNLLLMQQLTELIDRQEEISGACEADIVRLRERIRQLSAEENDASVRIAEQNALLRTLESRRTALLNEWEMNYKAYYNVDKVYDVLPLSDDELRARFTAMLAAGSEDAKAIEDKRLLMETLSASMKRCLRGIEQRGIDVKKLEADEAGGLLYLSDEQVLSACRRSMDDARKQVLEAEHSLKNKEQAVHRLEGSIEYAVANIEEAFGGYHEEEASLSEIVTNLENGEALLERLTREAQECEEALKRYSRQQGYMIDLYKDVRRIVALHDISLEQAVSMPDSKEKLREIFDEKLLLFDRSTKAIERAKAELAKFKGSTASTLEQMQVYELANTIREDVAVPADYEQAKQLTESLGSMTEYIQLERDRVEKSLADMENIKANFEEQCLQRCLDVRTELDKLPKLSRILVDGEAIQMVGLTIPYVREEFLRQRMSDYIDRIVAQADDYNSDKERIKFIRGSLTLKKLFGVIVTDMNAIRLSLYKRERMKEQSRYLRYEEAVGSTGQSQGIYIQFLISIINYISGMYQTGGEDEKTKTVFIDNPFGAAKDVYIWEPIFTLLKANHVQLIVPARGATPAITGRFDVNYILGQQMTGGRQLTVVTDYTSSVDQEELEYRDLEYEQVSFDFI